MQRQTTFKKMMKKITSLLLLVVLVGSFVGTFKLASASASRRFMPQSTYLSPVREAPMVFTGLGVSWHEVIPEGTSATLSVRFRDLNGKWSDWQAVVGEYDELEAESAAHPSAFLATPRSDALQYRIYLHTENTSISPILENISFTYINAKKKIALKADKTSVSLKGVARLTSAKIKAIAAAPKAKIAAESNSTVLTVSKTITPDARADALPSSVKIISRADWGADESLRYFTEDRPDPQLIKLDDDFYTQYSDELKIVKTVATDSNGQKLTWPLQYPAKVSKFIIHHTATTTNLDDPEKAIRDIYYWQAISKGWGDIGYNYLIDQQGNIYEGRYGGDGVVGAHAGPGNVGSIGIAILGNYQNDQVPDAVVKSLTALIKMKAAKFGIDPAGTSKFRGEDLPNVIGHRDVMKTACPGDNLYALLPAIRLAAKGDFKPKIVDKRRLVVGKENDYDYSLQKTPDILTLQPGSTKTLTVSVKNTGKKSWGPQTVFLVSNDENASTFLARSNMVGSKAYGKSIEPGSSATFNIPLQSGYNGGITTLQVFPFIDNKVKLEKYISIPVQIEQPVFDYEYVGLDLSGPYLKIGESAQAVLTLKNTGNVTWQRDGKNRFMIGTDKPRDRLSRITGAPSARLGAMKESAVKPGEIAHFNLNIKAPLTEGQYKEYWAPVIEGVKWLASNDKPLDLYVYSSPLLAKSSGVSGDLNLLPSATGVVTLEYLNAGGYTWKSSNNGFRLEIDKQNNLKIRSVTVEQDQILPGQKARIDVSFRAPNKEGVYALTLMPKVGKNDLLSRPEKIYVKVSKKSSTLTKNKTALPIVREETPVREESPAANSDKIRVAISFHANPVISGSGAFALYEGEKRLGDFAKDEKVSVTFDGEKYTISGDKQTYITSRPPRFIPNAGTILRIDNYANRPAWDTSLNNNEFRGVLEVNYYAGEMQTINELPVEDYLKGLAEISASDPYEKIKAIIVLARSYAYYYMKIGKKFPGAPFNLTDDPARSQKYLGYGFEKRNPTGVKAVNDTAGMVVKYKGNLIKTPYFSADDGRTRSAEEVWGWTDTPWLISVDDPGCKGLSMNGHGVGLSGCGALYWANKGKTFQEIIEYYFKGVTVEKL
jgi:hypothetical protein